MANGAKVALAVGAGYLLGRSRKMKLALMLAAAGVTGKFPARPTDVVAHGLKSLGGSEQLGQLTEQLRGDLVGAARSAALTAVTNRVDSLNDRLQGVTSAVGADEVLDDVGSTVGDTVNTVGDTVNLGGRRRRTRSKADEYLDEDDAYGEPEDEDEEPLDVDEVDDGIDEDEDEYLDETDVDEEPELEEDRPQPPVTRRRASGRATAPRTAVRRPSRVASHEEPSARAARRRHTATATKRSAARRGR